MVVTVCVGVEVWRVFEVTVVNALVLLRDGGVWADWLDVAALLELGVGARLVSWIDTVVAISTDHGKWLVVLCAFSSQICGD